MLLYSSYFYKLVDILTYFTQRLTYLLTWWRYFQCNDILLDILMLWQTFWCPDLPFYIMIYFPYFLMTWHTFWFYDICHICTFQTSWHVCWHNEIPFDIMTTLICFHILLALTHTFYVMAYFGHYDILFDVMAHFLLSWCTFFYIKYVFFGAMKYFLMSWSNFLLLAYFPYFFWHYDRHFDGMMYILTSWRTFTLQRTLWHMFWRHDILHMLFDIIMCF